MYVIQCTKTGYFDFYGPHVQSFDCYARKGQFFGQDFEEFGEEAKMVSNINNKCIMVFPTRKSVEETLNNIDEPEFLDGDAPAEFTIRKVNRAISFAA